MGSGIRKLTIQIIMLSVALLYLARLFYIQVIDSTSASEIRLKEVEAPRGLIKDRHGEILVANQPMYNLMLVAANMESMDTVKLAGLLKLELDIVRERIKKARRHPFNPSLFQRQIDYVEFGRLQEQLHLFPGFYGEVHAERIYPYGHSAHVLGYIGMVDSQEIKTDNYYTDQNVVGKTGLEKCYEKALRGVKGSKWLLYDVHNRAKGSYKEGADDVLPIPGTNLISTLDAKLQDYGERLMKNKKGSIVAIEPKSGEILAFVSSPSYNPKIMVGQSRGRAFEALKKDSLDPLFNRPVMAMYPPGSTYKSIMSLIGLQEGVDIKGRFKCKGEQRIPGTVACHDHEPINGVKGAIRYSCNNYFSSVMKALFDLEKFKNAAEAYESWYTYSSSFGLGQKISPEFEFESAGNLPKKDYYDRLYRVGGWKAPTIISLSVGQGELLMTPMQIANTYACIANKGYFIEPHLIKELETFSKTNQLRFERKEAGISSEHFEKAIEGLEEVVKEGTARGSQIKNISMCGKTGTAENPHGKDHSIFAAFAPKEEPQIAISVFVENSGYGSTWAAPIASLMIEQYLKGSIEGGYRESLEKRMLEGDLINEN